MSKLKRLFIRFNTAISTNYSRLVKREIYRSMYEIMAHSNKESGIAEPAGENELIVSLTTYGERVYTVHKTIESLMMQTLKANRIILWLDENEFSLDSIPMVLKGLMKRGLEIRFCPNYKSYKKLIPTLQLFANSHIITVDDDIIYPLDMIENMYRTHCRYPDCVIFNYGAEIALDQNNSVRPYEKWRMEGDFSVPSLLYMGIGVGGVFYPCNSFNSDVLDIEAFEKLAPKADDLWFKVMTYRNGIKQVQTNFGKKILNSNDFLDEFITVEDEQRERLGTENVINGQNDVQMANLIKTYNLEFKKEN